MMANAKTAVLELVGKQPDDVSWEELTQKIYFRERIERGLQQIENGEHEDADAVFDELLREEPGVESESQWLSNGSMK